MKSEPSETESYPWAVGFLVAPRKEDLQKQFIDVQCVET